MKTAMDIGTQEEVGVMWKQEWHETAAKTSGPRARQLRKEGFKVTVGSMGMQVTPVGRVKLSLLTIHNAELGHIPDPPENGRPVKF